MKNKEIVWAFDLGKASIGEAVKWGLFLNQSIQNKTGMGATRAGFVFRNAFEQVYPLGG